MCDGPIAALSWLPATGTEIVTQILSYTVDLKKIGLGGHATYKVTDLWSGSKAKTYTEAELGNFGCTVKRDNTALGGISVFKIEPA